MNKTTRREVFFVESWLEEERIDEILQDKGFDLDNTTWIYTWTIPEYVTDEDREIITQKLEDSQYVGYLVSVREELS